MNRRKIVVIGLTLLVLGATAYWVALPSGLIVWRMGVIEKERKDAVSAVTKRLTSPEDEEQGFEILNVGKSTIAVDEERVIRRDANGQVTWSTKLAHAPWKDLVTDKKRVFLQQQGIVALDLDTGKIAWETPVPCGRFCLSDGLVVTAGGNTITGLKPVTGEQVFQRVLPATDGFGTRKIFPAGDVFVIRGWKESFVIARNGEIRHHFSRQIVDVLAIGNDRVFLTSNDVVRVTPDDEIVWSIALADYGSHAGGRIISLESGDLVAFLFGRIRDSGVEVVRLDPSGGGKIWRHYCQPLGVTHSEYDHEAKVEVMANRLLVTSRGRETFVELLDLASGWQIERQRRPN